MRYVIMANGKGSRWGNYQGVPKHLVEVDGETLLARTVRLAREADADAEVVIASWNPAYEVPGARRHVPERSALELDRFTYELICDGVCFLYGDVFYTEDAIRDIVATGTDELVFFGSERSIVAVKCGDAALMRKLLDGLYTLIEAGTLNDGKGWTLYHHYLGMPLEGRAIRTESYGEPTAFRFIVDTTRDFNTPADYDSFIAETDK